MIFPIITRSTRVTPTLATSIDHILTTVILSAIIYSGIMPTDISDYVPIFAFDNEEIGRNENCKKTIIKQEINECSNKAFKNIPNNCN